MSEDFDLGRTVRAVLAESDTVNPDDLAGEVLARIPRQERARALKQALPQFVRAESRRSGGSFALPADPPGGQGHIDTQTSPAAGGRTSSRSTKVAGIRDWFEQVKRQRINVGDGYRFLAECTIPDLEAAAAIREDHARATHNRAVQLRAIAALMSEHGAATVADLPDAVLRPVLGDAA